MVVSEANRVGVIVLAVEGLQLNLPHLVQIRVVVWHMWEVHLLDPTNKRMLQGLQRCESVSRVNLQNLLHEVVKLNDLSALVDTIVHVLTLVSCVLQLDVVPFF